MLAGSALFCRRLLARPAVRADARHAAGDAESFQPFWDTYSAITDRYAGGAVDRKSLVEGAIKGMIGSLDDPYSQYLTSEEFQASLQWHLRRVRGHRRDDRDGRPDGRQPRRAPRSAPECLLVVVSPLDGSPAKAAGLLAGDVIVGVDGPSLGGPHGGPGARAVRGPKDSTVTLWILRGEQTPFDVDVRRAVIVQPEVESEDRRRERRLHQAGRVLRARRQ